MDEPRIPPPQEAPFLFFDLTENPKAFRPSLLSAMDDGSVVVSRQHDGHELLERGNAIDFRRIAAQYATLAVIVEQGLVERFRPGRDEPGPDL